MEADPSHALAGRPPAPPPARHLELTDLPPAVADRLRFERAAPRRLRGEQLPEPVRAELALLWNGIVADVYDEVTGLRRHRALRSSTVERALRRVSDRVLQAERVIIFAAVHYPLTDNQPAKHLALAGLGGGSAAAAEELAIISSVGTAAAVAILTAVVGEVFETYVAASARTGEYRRAGRSPDPDIILTDLSESAGYGASVGRRVNPAMARDAAAWLSEQVITRTATRFSRALVPIAGVAIGAGMSVFNVRRATRSALRPPAPDELVRLADGIVQDDLAYAEARQRYLELPDPPAAPI